MGSAPVSNTTILVVDEQQEYHRLGHRLLESRSVRQRATKATSRSAAMEKDEQNLVISTYAAGHGRLDVARGSRAKQTTLCLMLTARGGDDDMLQGWRRRDDHLVSPSARALGRPREGGPSPLGSRGPG